jgi:hypothetical protein
VNAIDVLREFVCSGPQGGRRHGKTAVANSLAAVVSLVEAAEPMANLPWPLSPDERQEWIVNQNRLRAALRAVKGEHCASLGDPDEADACLIALAPDLARLALDMGEELRKHSSQNEHDYVNHAKADALLARLDGIGNKDGAA